jgi:hypothetical protein
MRRESGFSVRQQRINMQTARRSPVADSVRALLMTARAYPLICVLRRIVAWAA